MAIRKWRTFFLIGGALVVTWVLAAQPEPGTPPDTSSAVRGSVPKTTQAERAALRKRQKRIRVAARPLSRSEAIEVFGAVVYDPGSPADFFRTDTGTGNQIVGNVFNSALGSPLLATGSITHFTIFPNAADGNVIISLLGPPSGTTAAPIVGFSVSVLANNYFNQVGVAPLPVGSSFLVGQYVGTYNGPDSIGMRTAQVNGQGFHAMQINFVNSTAATGFQTLPSQNAMVRLLGNVLVPVELMSFTVE